MFQHFLEVYEMLITKDFSRCYQTALVAVVGCQEHGQESHHGFPAAYISLQEPVHLMSCGCILANFPDDPFLGTREFKGEGFCIKIIEKPANLAEHNATRLFLALCFYHSCSHLVEKYLFNLQTD